MRQHPARAGSPSSRIPAHRLRQLARRHTLLVAYLHELEHELTDQVLDMFDRLIGELPHKDERKQTLRLQHHVKSFTANLCVLAAAVDVPAVRGADCALEALGYVQDLAQHKRRVTRKVQRVAGDQRHLGLDGQTDAPVPAGISPIGGGVMACTLAG